MYATDLFIREHSLTCGLDLSVDLRDAVGDRLHLSDGFKRDGVSHDPRIIANVSLTWPPRSDCF
jgi:hypothetical protein